MPDEPAIRDAFRRRCCAAMGAPITGRVAGALAECLTRHSRTGAAALDWPGEPTRDALPLRLVGGFHALHLHRRDAAVSRVFTGAARDRAGVQAILAIAARADALLPWLGGPPQTK